MKVAIMQPYLFPYIGYFQLINAVDNFVFYDDVNYIKQGWINRNRILLNNNDYLFTVPLKNASSFMLINETFINENLYEKWRSKFLQTIVQSYKKAPQFECIYDLIKLVLDLNCNTISELAIESVVEVSNYLDINTQFRISSKKYTNNELERQERLINICKMEGATNYINPIGGQELYKKEYFKKEGLTLDFIKSLSIDYEQFGGKFVPWLSIIDVLMFNSKEDIKEMLNKYELI